MKKLIIYDKSNYCLINFDKIPKIISDIFLGIVSLTALADEKFKGFNVCFSQDGANAFLYFENANSIALASHFMQALTKNLSLIRKNSVGISDFLDLTGSSLFHEVARDEIIGVAKSIFIDVMPPECEYFYDRQKVSAGDLIFKNKSVFNIFKKSIAKFNKNKSTDQEDILIYTTNYLSFHNSFVINAFTEKSCSILLLKNTAENLVESSEFLYFNNLDDAVRIFTLLKAVILGLGIKIKVHVSPDLISITPFVEFLAGQGDEILFHLSSEMDNYGGYESKALALILDETFENISIAPDINGQDELFADPINKILVEARKFNLKPIKNPPIRKTKISFIVTAHNENYMAIRSIWNIVGVISNSKFLMSECEIVCVLDNANSSTEKAIHFFQKYMHDQGVDIIRVIKTSYGDLSRARNFAVSETRSCFISIHDADDFISLNWLDCLAEKSNEFEDRLSVFHPKVNYFFGTDERVMWSPCMVDDRTTIKWSNFLVDNFWTSCSAGSREIYDKHPYIPIDRSSGIGYEDWSWNVKLIKQNYVHIAIPDTTLFVRLKYQKTSLNKQSSTGGLMPDLRNMLNVISDRIEP